MNPAFITRKEQLMTLDRKGLRRFLALAAIRKRCDPSFDPKLISIAQEMRQQQFSEARLAALENARELIERHEVEGQALRLFTLRLDQEEAREHLQTVEALIKQAKEQIELQLS